MGWQAADASDEGIAISNSQVTPAGLARTTTLTVMRFIPGSIPGSGNILVQTADGSVTLATIPVLGTLDTALEIGITLQNRIGGFRLLTNTAVITGVLVVRPQN